MEDDVFEINRRNWEERVAIHLRDATGSYNIEDFIAGEQTGSTGFPKMGPGLR